ncbi:MAG: efflux RND transporter periplasmic adaptor subunit [Robiginitomaculum sp.]|nr:efflux RND transporter periplasmic adaptor subunit [Robiginitomaculum sp.]
MAIAILGLTACQDKQAATIAEPVQPIAAVASMGQIAKIINSSGHVKPKITVQVGSEVSGKVIAVNVDFNSIVKKGDILALIDPDNFNNRVAQEQARVENADAQIKVNQASLKRSNVNLTQAKRSYERRKQLYAENAISQAQLEETERAMLLAQADIELAQARLDAARSSLRQSKANLRTAMVDLSRTVIRAPIDGIVIERKIDPGQTVAASLSAPELFKIVNDLSELQVEASIVESDVSGLDAGDKVSFNVDAYPTRRFSGTVEQLRLQSQKRNNIVTYTAIVNVDNSDGLLLPGMTANLQITTDLKRNILRIPAAAERFRPNAAQIQKWKVEEKAGDNTQASPKVRSRLQELGLSTSKIDQIFTRLDKDTKQIRADIEDPVKSFRRTPNLKRLAAMTQTVLKDTLSTTEYQTYQQIKQSQSQTREADIWLLTNDKIRKTTVSLGLSDGSFVEVLSGVTEGEQVVTGFSGAPPKGARGKRRG